MRCRACDAKLTQFDITSMKSDTLPEPEDLCSHCRDVAYMDELSFDDISYAFEDITESLVFILNRA